MDNETKFSEISHAEWCELVIEYDPFEGDFGDGTERTLRDEVGVAGRRGGCRCCGQPILKGEIVRVIKKVDSEGFYGGRCCVQCCEAMAKVSFALRGGFGDDDEAYAAAIDAMEERAALLAVVPHV